MSAPTGEPTAEEAAAFIQSFYRAGVVDRLDLVHTALRQAYLRGRTDVREESTRMSQTAVQRFVAKVQKVAEESAEEFTSWVTEGAMQDARREEMPWPRRMRAVRD